jgi:murein DD-endopeptidase MepM/ murein hydrolase activator NlpD
MSSVTAKAGQRINAGALVGYSGTQNGGHVHVEYRTPGPTSSGYQIVDPRTKLNGSALPGGGAGPYNIPGYGPAPAMQTYGGSTTAPYQSGMGDFTSYFLSLAGLG